MPEVPIWTENPCGQKGIYKLTPPFYPLDPRNFGLEESIFYYVEDNYPYYGTNGKVRRNAFGSFNGTEEEMEAEWREKDQRNELMKRQNAGGFDPTRICYRNCSMYHPPVNY